MIQIPQEFRDLLKLLSEEQVKYLVIGGYAVIHHGYPRSTLDIDLWFADSSDNRAALRRALLKFGFSDAAFGPLVFDDLEVISFGIEPLRVDLRLRTTGLDFEEAYARCERLKFDDFEIPLLSLKDLRTSKSAAGRFKDLADLENLPTA